MLLPGFFPRVGTLFFSGFDAIPRLFALLCFQMRLLPQGHPFFHTDKKFGVRHVLAEAGRRLSFRWKNIDQIIIYAVLVCGTAAMFGFIAVLFAYISFSFSAHAAAWVPGIFDTAQPDKDVAFMMLDRVFGIPGIFDSEIITNPTKYGPAPNSFQLALQSFFGFFSWGLFILALFIFLYYLVEIVWDITQEGKVLDSISDDDGSGEKGFSWIPLRLVLALGLLIPLSSGLNSAQYITLYVAKMGSGLATNAWGYFNVMTSAKADAGGSGANPFGVPNEALIADVPYQDVETLMKSLMIVKSCVFINNLDRTALAAQGVSSDGDGTYGSYDVGAYVINESGHKAIKDFFPDGKYNPTPLGIISSDGADPFVSILGFSGGQGIRVIFGHVSGDDPTKYKEYPGGVLPVCGEVEVPVSSFNGEGLFAAEANFFSVLYLTLNYARNGGELDKYEQDSVLAVTREYMRTSSGWQVLLDLMSASVNKNIECYDEDPDDSDLYQSVDEENFIGDYLGKCTEAVPFTYWNSYLKDSYLLFTDHPIAAAYNYLTDEAGDAPDQYWIGDTSSSALGVINPMMITADMMNLGWGGAGLWYTRIAEKNGSFVTAVENIPTVRKMPMVMEKIKGERGKNDAGVGKGFCQAYSPQKSGSTSANISDERAQFSAELVKNLHTLCSALFENENIKLENYGTGHQLSQSKPSNAIEHAMASVFGQLKLFDIRQNDEVLPMAQLASVGKMLVDKSIMSIIAAVGLSASGSALHVVAGSATGENIAALNTLGEAFGEASGAALTFATLGLTIGVVLHYVLPFLPFMYFFFAVGRWVKTIFEAMVGVPLWALAHLRRSGPGLPGDAASSGYFLLLEILVRPIVTVISLVGTYAVFNALVLALNSIFVLVTSNFAGADAGSIVSAFEASSTEGTKDAVDVVRGIADQFFLTVLYVLLTYMIATSSFKLIDLIPDNILRWSGAGVSSMGASDNADDLIDQLQYQLPLAVRYFTHEVSQGINETIYQPGKAFGEGRQAQYEHLKAQIMDKVGKEGSIKVSDVGGGGTSDQALTQSAFDALVQKGQLVRDDKGVYHKPKGKG